MSCTEGGRTLIFDSLVSDFGTTIGFRPAFAPWASARRISRTKFGMILSQRKLNCALFVKNSLIKNFPEARKSGGNLNLQDRTNLDSALTSRFQVRMVRISVRHFCRIRQTLSPKQFGAPNFYGEFDSGSERTLAAWIRHASRTGLLL